ncbi:MAG: hypothetical protein JW384_04424 [Nitrosomonadaceae bacterium]|nr:hypothetical protein [Nitrosomonadaceae bacterium]
MTLVRLWAYLAGICLLHAAEKPLDMPAAAKGYLPVGWKVETLVQGDLNADGLSDLAFVRVGTDSKKITKRSDGFAQDRNPRVLVVLLARKEGYAKVGEYLKFIPPAFEDEYENLLDRYDGLKLEKGVLVVCFQWFVTAGSWSVGEWQHKFRLEAGRLRLIGTEHNIFMRNSGEKTLTSTNYLTGKRKITSGLNQFDDEPSRPKVEWEALDSKKPIFIEDLPPIGREE